VDKPARAMSPLSLIDLQIWGQDTHDADEIPILKLNRLSEFHTATRVPKAIFSSYLLQAGVLSLAGGWLGKLVVISGMLC
jgi:hypothetical protein